MSPSLSFWAESFMPRSATIASWRVDLGLEALALRRELGILHPHVGLLGVDRRSWMTSAFSRA